MDDISPPRNLQPKARFIEEIGERCINMDGVIEVARTTDTPKAKAIYRAFRRRLVEVQRSHPELALEKQREEAILAAIRDCGNRINFIPVKSQ